MKLIRVTLSLALVLIFQSMAFSQMSLPALPEDISPLLIGEKIPEMRLQNEKGEWINTGLLMTGKPTVLIFYRGGWCPYCNQHLSEISEIEQKILALGFQIIAISPDAVQKLGETAGKQKLNYHLFSDSAGTFAKSMGISFQAPNHYLKLINESSMGRNKETLPVPSLFVVNTKLEILFEHIQPNFKTRISSKLLLSVLEGLK